MEIIENLKSHILSILCKQIPFYQKRSQKPIKQNALQEMREILLFGEGILEELAEDNQPQVLKKSFELFSKALQKLLSLSAEELSKVLDDYFILAQPPSSFAQHLSSFQNSDPRLRSLLFITEAIFAPFFNSLDIAIEKKRPGNALKLAGHYLFNCLELYFKIETLSLLDKVWPEVSRKDFLSELIDLQKTSFHNLQYESKLVFADRFFPFYNYLYLSLEQNIALESMDSLSEFLFFIVYYLLENKTIPEELANWLPNAVSNRHNDNLDYLVLYSPNFDVSRNELESLIIKAEALYSFDKIKQWQTDLMHLLANMISTLKPMKKNTKLRHPHMLKNLIDTML